jgi:hypothetical protein
MSERDLSPCDRLRAHQRAVPTSRCARLGRCRKGCREIDALSVPVLDYPMLGNQARGTVLLEAAQQAKHLTTPQPDQHTAIAYP